MREPNNIRVPRVAVKYHEFLAENVERSKAILARETERHNQRMRDYEDLKARLARDNTLGYLGKLTEFLFTGVPAADITAAYDRLLALRRANVRIDIDSAETLERLQDILAAKETDLQAARALSRFPPAQRRLFPAVTMTKDDKALLVALAGVDASQFMRKVSGYKDKATLLDNARRFLRSVSKPADRDYFRGLAGGGLRLVHDGERLQIFRTQTVGDLLKIAGDAAWCIRSPATFKSYTSKGAAQFVLIDHDKGRWDPLFKIGFTVNAGGTITHAHDAMDTSVKPHVADLLTQQGVSVPAILAKSGAKAAPRRPQGPRASLRAIHAWLDANQAQPDDARELIEMVSAKIEPDDLSKRWVRQMLVGLILALRPERLITEDELRELLPDPVARAIKRDHVKSPAYRQAMGEPWLNFEDVVLFDPRSKNIEDLSIRMLPHLDALRHNIFDRSSVKSSVMKVLELVGSRRAREIRPDISDQMRRLIAMNRNRNLRDLLLAAVDKAETGRPPDYEVINPLITACYMGQDDSIDTLVALEVKMPFDEELVIRLMRGYREERARLESVMALTDFARGVTLTNITDYRHTALFNQLVGAGVAVSVETTQWSVISMLDRFAVWTAATGQYRPASAHGLPAWAEDPALRRLIVRPKKHGRFDFPPGTQFPVTFRGAGYTVTIDENENEDE